MNLVPTQPGKTPSYWCTWGAQNYASDDMDDTSWNVAYNNLDEATLFDSPGWATCCFDAVRPDLYLLFDVGWDAPAGVDIEHERWRLGSLEVDTGRFPSCTGTPPERLAQLNGLVQSAGWRGAAVWVAPFAVGEGKDNFTLTWDALEDYYRERMRWSRAAGIGYWKVDTGLRGEDVQFRRMLTRTAAQVAPDLVIEHALPLGPLNDESTPWDHFENHSSGRYQHWDTGRVLSKVLELVSFSDVVRTYDVTNQLSVATTLDRVAAILSAAPASSGMGLLNAENELYLAVALGCAFGVMRHPDWRDVPGTDYDPYQWRKRGDEVVRAARWQRIAPAFSAAYGAHLSDELLTDSWLFREGDTWATFYYDRLFEQSAPARVSRGLPLPEVLPGDGDELPYVVCSRHPNGPITAATLPRTSADGGIFHPRAHVTLDLPEMQQPVGIFGHYASLTLHLPEPLAGRTVWIQDLAGDTAVDASNAVAVDDRRLVLSGEWIDRAGTAAASKGDISGPGLVLVLKE
jgi:hypothetical protein